MGRNPKKRNHSNGNGSNKSRNKSILVLTLTRSFNGVKCCTIGSKSADPPVEVDVRCRDANSEKEKYSPRRG